MPEKPNDVDPFAARYGAAGNFCQRVATQRGESLDFDEFGDLDSGSVNPNYRAPLVYQQPRSARIQFRVGF